MTGADRERNRQNVRNLIALTSDRNDGTAPFATQYVWDNDPTSATYAGPGTGAGPTPPAASSAGPMGQRVLRMSSPVWSTAQQAITAGQARWRRPPPSPRSSPSRPSPTRRSTTGTPSPRSYRPNGGGSRARWSGT
jgi:hypothetical protein